MEREHKFLNAVVDEVEEMCPAEYKWFQQNVSGRGAVNLLMKRASGPRTRVISMKKNKPATEFHVTVAFPSRIECPGSIWCIASNRVQKNMRMYK